jgi:hypothetical protein
MCANEPEFAAPPNRRRSADDICMIEPMNAQMYRFGTQIRAEHRSNDEA